MKKFKKESDYITGELMFEANQRRISELRLLSKQHERTLEQTRHDLEKEHRTEMKQIRKTYDRELNKAAKLVESLREKIKDQTIRHDKKIADVKREKMR